MTLRVWELAAVALGTTGCSFFMNTAPAAPSERTTPAASECTSSMLLPTGDAITAAVGAVNIGISASAEDQVRYYGVTMDKQVGLAIGITQFAVFGAAAAYGYVQASRCNALRREVHLDDDPPAAREAPVRGPAEPTATAEDASASDAPPIAEPHRELPSWSALRRVPMTATTAPPRPPSRFSGTPP